jgi:hypothetical protein
MKFNTNSFLCWVLKENVTQKLSVFERKILMKIFGPTKEANGIWRIKTNKELDELIKHRNIINYVKAQGLSWFGHTNRMPETSTVKRILKWKPFRARAAGRLKSRREDDIRNDLKKMELTKWAEQVQDRLQWEDMVERAKTVSELLRQRRRRRSRSRRRRRRRKRRTRRRRRRKRRRRRGGGRGGGEGGEEEGGGG